MTLPPAIGSPCGKIGEAIIQTQQTSERPVGVGLLFAALQFLLAATWTAYALYLPQLLDKAGLGKALVVPLLMLDQAIFAATDIAASLWIDRAARVVGRVGKWIALLTGVSSLAFLAMPHAADMGAASQPLLIALILVWTATSAALRAPPLALVKKYAAKPALPWLAGMSALGLGLAGIAAPALTAELRDIDPRWPFALASLSLFAAAYAAAAMERRLAAAPRAEVAPASRPKIGGGLVLLLATLVGLGLGAQLHTGLVSPRLFAALASPPDLDRLASLFWIGFTCAAAFAALAPKTWSVFAIIGVASLAGAALLGGAALAPVLVALIAAQLAAGAAWGLIKANILTAALTFNAGARDALIVGLVFCAEGLAATLRLAMVRSGVAADPAAAFVLVWIAPALWALCGAAMLALARRTSALARVAEKG